MKRLLLSLIAAGLAGFFVPAQSQITDRLSGIQTGLAVKAPVKVATTSNITLSGEQTIGSTAVVDGDRVLVAAQTDATENGIYVVDTSAWDRAADFDGNRDVANGTLVVVPRSTGQDYFYQVDATDPVVIGTSDINFTLTNDPNVTYDVTDAEIAVGLTIADINAAYIEGDVYRYGYTGAGGAADITARTNAFAVVVEIAGGGYGPIRAPYIEDGWVILGSPETTIFGTGSDAIQEALDLADTLDMGVRVSGTWDGLEAQATDPGGQSRVAAIYLPNGVSLEGSGRYSTRLKLADGCNCQLLVLEEEDTSTAYNLTISELTLDGNKNNQSSDGGAALVYLNVTGTAVQNFVLARLRIVNAYKQALNITSAGADYFADNIFVYQSGATGSGICAVELGGADNIFSNFDIGQSAGCGAKLAGASQYNNMKSWFSGTSDTTNGHCFYVTTGSGLTRFNGWAQDCAGDGMQIFSSTGGAPGHNLIELIAHCVEGSGIQIGTNINNSDFTILASDSGTCGNGVTDTNQALRMNGMGNAGNRIRVYSESGVPHLYTTTPAVGQNVIIYGDAPIQTFAESDTTPSVVGSETFLGATNAPTITKFDDCYSGQRWVVVEQGATVYDMTGQSLIGSSADITVAANDVTTWVCVDGTNSSLIGYVDASVDNSGGA